MRDDIDITKPLTVPVEVGCAVLGVGKTKFRELMAEGLIKSIKLGTRRLAVYASIEELVKSRAA